MNKEIWFLLNDAWANLLAEGGHCSVGHAPAAGPRVGHSLSPQPRLSVAWSPLVILGQARQLNPTRLDPRPRATPFPPISVAPLLLCTTVVNPS
jgi:hypothetical protein